MIENYKRRCREAKLEMSLIVLARTTVDKGGVGSDYLRYLAFIDIEVQQICDEIIL